MLLFVFHVGLAITLFLIVNWIGRHSAPFGYRTLSLYERVEEAPAFNLLFRVAAPVVFLLIVAAVLALLDQFQLAADIWRVTAFYFVIRIAFNLVMGRAVLINWWAQLTLGAIATGISYWLSKSVLTSAQRALPDAADFTAELWLIVLLFLYQTLNRLRTSGDVQARRQDKYLSSHYAKFRTKYHDVIAAEVPNEWVEALVYAILIFEDFNRPPFARLLENRVFFPLGLASTLGPMQVASDRRLSNEEGVRLGARKVAALYPEAEQAEAESLREHFKAQEQSSNGELPGWVRELIGRRVAVKYNPDGRYADEVRSIYSVILQRYYRPLRANEDDPRSSEGVA
jgi:hypothetical protein